MWILLAFGSAFFAGITSVLAKCGIKSTDSHVATAIRTGVVLVCACLMAGLAGSFSSVLEISPKTWVFLILSGMATGASWLCYFKALQLGDLNRVAPVDKFSGVLTVLLAFLFLREEITWVKALSVLVIGIGTYWMIDRGKREKFRGQWLVYAALSALFAAMTAILGKVGIEGVESHLGTAIRTGVVLPMAWGMVFLTGKQGQVCRIPKRELVLILLSGIATGASWLCYYGALKVGPVGAVVSVDKMSILITILFSRLVLGEKLSKRAGWGLLLLTAGTMGMLLG